MSDNALKNTAIEVARRLRDLRHEKTRYISPQRWLDAERQRTSEEARQHPQRAMVNMDTVRLASQWAVANARRTQAPAFAATLDNELHRRDVDVAALRREVDDLRAEARTQPQTERSGQSLVSAATSVAVTAALFANADTWADDFAGKSFVDSIQNWDDVLDVDAADELTPDTELGLEPDSPMATAEMDGADVDADMDSMAVATVPEGTFPYSIEDQMEYVAANGTAADTDSGATVDMDAAASVDAGPALA